MTNEEKILEMLAEMRADISGLKSGQESLIAGQERLEAGQKSLEARQEKLESRQEKLESRQEKLETDVRHMHILLERQEHNISLIAEQYGDIAKKLERVHEIDDLRDRVQTLETVARRHSAKLRELDKAE